ncbi:uncharacterized protein LOC131056298 [Cryptomeria japonica]|uniref:uncharacterized protein LOC131056298 n=1 Tax=Cryptomeria japonica TaxID=3369 RepID=UPI0027D9F4CF|nr:uncharacterized protein LOC131056298 [Cryptomeria japonica]
MVKKFPLMLGKKCNDRDSVAWMPPKPGWLKLNFNGASKGNPGASGIGCVVRDHNGLFKGKMALSIALDTNNIAEFKALLLGLLEFSSRGIKHVVVEGDLAIAINAVKTIRLPNWRLQALLERILKELSRFDDFSCKHVYREANLEADALSKIATDGTNLSWWADEFKVTYPSD